MPLFSKLIEKASDTKDSQLLHIKLLTGGLVRLQTQSNPLKADKLCFFIENNEETDDTK